jgi:Domain of unknown function (DUF1937)
MTYLYLASPYTHPDSYVREARYLEAIDALNHLLRNRIWTYSPIVHCHELAKRNNLPKDHDFWSEYNHLMILNSRGLAILQSPGWDSSKGIADENLYAKHLDLPRYLMRKEGPHYAITTLGDFGSSGFRDSDNLMRRLASPLVPDSP